MFLGMCHLMLSRSLSSMIHQGITVSLFKAAPSKANWSINVPNVGVLKPLPISAIKWRSQIVNFFSSFFLVFLFKTNAVIDEIRHLNNKWVPLWWLYNIKTILHIPFVSSSCENTPKDVTCKCKDTITCNNNIEVPKEQ